MPLHSCLIPRKAVFARESRVETYSLGPSLLVVVTNLPPQPNMAFIRPYVESDQDAMIHIVSRSRHIHRKH